MSSQLENGDVLPNCFLGRRLGCPLPYPIRLRRTRAQFAVVRRVLDIDVTKPQLKPPRIVPCIGQQMAARVPEHVYGNPARSPAPSTIFETLKRVMGPPRSDANTNAPVA